MSRGFRPRPACQAPGFVESEAPGGGRPLRDALDRRSNLRRPVAPTRRSVVCCHLALHGHGGARELTGHHVTGGLRRHRGRRLRDVPEPRLRPHLQSPHRRGDCRRAEDPRRHQQRSRSVDDPREGRRRRGRLHDSGSWRRGASCGADRCWIGRSLVRHLSPATAATPPAPCPRLFVGRGVDVDVPRTVGGTRTATDRHVAGCPGELGRRVDRSAPDPRVGCRKRRWRGAAQRRGRSSEVR